MAVIIGVDPHKRSTPIVVIDDAERELASGRFANDSDGYRAMRAMARRWRDRTWAVEGAAGAGKHIAQRLVADRENVLDVPAKAGCAGAGVFDRQRSQERSDRCEVDRDRGVAHT